MRIQGLPSVGQFQVHIHLFDFYDILVQYLFLLPQTFETPPRVKTKNLLSRCRILPSGKKMCESLLVAVAG